MVNPSDREPSSTRMDMIKFRSTFTFEEIQMKNLIRVINLTKDPVMHNVARSLYFTLKHKISND